jgi:hypothetical protein
MLQGGTGQRLRVTLTTPNPTHLTMLPFHPVPVIPTEAATEGLPRCDSRQRSTFISRLNPRCTHVGQDDKNGTLAESHVVVVPLQELKIVVEKVLAIRLDIRGDEELSNLVQLSNVDIGPLGDVVIAVPGCPKRRTIILRSNKRFSAEDSSRLIKAQPTGSPRPASSPLPTSCSSP